MEIYTAVGRYKKKNNRVIILRKQEAFSISPCEYILWKTLFWQVLNKEQIKKNYENSLETVKIKTDFGFHYYFARLMNMGLIVTGIGNNMNEAMLDLTKDLYPKEIKISNLK